MAYLENDSKFLIAKEESDTKRLGLQEIWIMDLLKQDRYPDGDSEFIAEVRFDHEPTENKMSSHDLKVSDFVEIHHGYQLIYCSDDEEEEEK